MGTTVKLPKDENGVKVDPTLYMSMIGSLFYLTSSRPDLSYSVGVCARVKAKSGSSSPKTAGATAGLLKLPIKPSRSKKNELAPKRKLILGTSSSPSSSPSVANKKLKAHPSPSSSESRPEVEESESKTDESNESFPDHVHFALESDESNSKDDIVPVPEEVSAPALVSSPLSSKGKGKKPVTTPISSPRIKDERTVNLLTRMRFFLRLWFATTNWKLTSHTATISFDMASFLYKVGIGLDIDLATIIYDQIISFWEGKKKNMNLPFPQVIYKILSMQRSDVKTEKEDLVAPSTVASYKAPAPIPDDVEASSSKKSKPQTLVFTSNEFPAKVPIPTASTYVSAELSGV
uniref:Uncharacterized protein n=1 Tax=Cannabis sativa TaxID=3483 RepID=A0A803NL54_CANSA